MLQLRPNCECGDRDLPPESTEARICSFECTFCEPCASAVLHGQCPSCGGELVVRPRRPAAKLVGSPASIERVFKVAGCAVGLAWDALAVRRDAEIESGQVAAVDGPTAIARLRASHR